MKQHLLLFLTLCIIPFVSWGQCTTTINNYPFFESFEQGLGGFVNEVELFCQPIDFITTSGPSPNSGISSAFDGNQYAYVPLNLGPINDCYSQQVSLLAPCFDLTSMNSPELRFWVNADSTSFTGILVQSSRDGGINWEGYGGDYSNFTFFMVLDQSPNTGWREVVIDLSSYTNEDDYRFRIGVVANYTTPLDVAVDAISIAESTGCIIPPVVHTVASVASTASASDGSITSSVQGGIPPYSYAWSTGATTANINNVATGAYSLTVTDANGCQSTVNTYVSAALACNGTYSNWPFTNGFESKSLGIFRQNKFDDNRNWKRRTGATPTSNTGPASAVEGSYYRHMEASGQNGNPYKSAILTTKKCLDLTSLNQAVFEFSYHAYGQHTGTLSVQASMDGGQTWTEDIWSVSGDQGDNWYDASIDLSPYQTTNTRLRIIAITGNGPRSDIAIDDLYIGEAGNNIAPTAPMMIQEPITTDDHNPKKLDIYPNPLTNEPLHYRFHALDEALADIYIYNASGMLVHQEQIESFKGTNRGSIALWNLPNGYYVFRLRSENQWLVRSFIISR
jgi:hypothetical protein